MIPFTSDLAWATLGAVPELLQTSCGSLTIGLDAQPGQSILIRGGTSSVGMATAVLARRLGMTVFSTTRIPDRADEIAQAHADIEAGRATGMLVVLPGLERQPGRSACGTPILDLAARHGQPPHRTHQRARSGGTHRASWPEPASGGTASSLGQSRSQARSEPEPKVLRVLEGQ